MMNLEQEIAATYAEYFMLKHGRTLAEDFGAPASDTTGFALKAVETFRGLAGVSDEDCSMDERILAQLRDAVMGLDRAPKHQRLGGLKCLCGSPSCPNPAFENDP